MREALGRRQRLAQMNPHDQAKTKFPKKSPKDICISDKKIDESHNKKSAPKTTTFRQNQGKLQKRTSKKSLDKRKNTPFSAQENQKNVPYLE